MKKMSGQTLLIVDQDRKTIDLCQSVLEALAYRVLWVDAPELMFQTLKDQKLDLLLLSLCSLGDEYSEWIDQVKRFAPDLAMVLMVSMDEVEPAFQMLPRGVDGLILKSENMSEDLVKTVQGVLEKKQKWTDRVRLQTISPLFHVTEQLLAETNPKALETTILRSVTTSFQAVFAGIYRVSAESGILEKICTVERPNSLTSTLLQQDLVEMAIADGAAILVNANTPDDHEAIQGLMREMDWDSLLVVPVRRNKVQYAFCACRASGEPGFQQADLEFLVVLARQAVVAMENTRLCMELKDIVRREEESQRALIQAEKMAAVGRLMASLAHEINNPLQSVRNCLHLAARPGIDSAQRMKYLEMTDSELERLVQTVRRMLDFYRLGGADKEKTDIRQIIEQVLALLRTQFSEQSIEVHVQYLGQFQCVSVVYDQIQQVIFNLLINAIDALSEIETSAAAKRDSKSSSSEAKEIWIDGSFEEKQVCIWIEDSGPGIPVELRERVFEPFVSTKPSGTGLGLAVCYGIMEQHQGQLKVIPSRYHNGACFEIILPVGDEG